MAKDDTISAVVGRLFLALAGVVLVVYGIAKVGYAILKADLPAFLETMVETAKNQEEVLTKLGGYKAYEYTFNKHDLAKDTLPYEVIVKGDTAYLLIRGYATKKKDDWVPVIKDSTFHSYE